MSYGPEYLLGLLESSVLAVYAPNSLCTPIPSWWGGVRRRKGRGSVHTPLTDKENNSILSTPYFGLCIFSTNPKPIALAATVKKINSNPAKISTISKGYRANVISEQGQGNHSYCQLRKHTQEMSVNEASLQEGDVEHQCRGVLCAVLVWCHGGNKC